PVFGLSRRRKEAILLRKETILFLCHWRRYSSESSRIEIVPATSFFPPWRGVAFPYKRGRGFAFWTDEEWRVAPVRSCRNPLDFAKNCLTAPENLIKLFLRLLQITQEPVRS